MYSYSLAMFNRGRAAPSARLKHAMQYLFITLLALNALSAVFWAGTSFTFARLGKAPEPPCDGRSEAPASARS